MVPLLTTVTAQSAHCPVLTRTAARARPFLLARYGYQAASMAITEWRTRYNAFIPQDPFHWPQQPISDLPYLQAFGTLLCIVLCRAAARQYDLVGQLIYKISEADFLAIPVLARSDRRGALVQPLVPETPAETRHRILQSRTYPKGFVMAFIRGDTRASTLALTTPSALCAPF